jgi:arylsulfatase A-like enzyme
MRRGRDASSATWVEILVAILVAVSIDLTLSTAHGYKLVRPMWPLPLPLLATIQVLAVEFTVLAMGSGTMVLALKASCRVESGWVRVLIASGTPLLFWRVVAGGDLMVWAWAIVHFTLIAGLFVTARVRATRWHQPTPRAIGLSFFCFLLILAAALWLPARPLSLVPEGRLPSQSSANAPDTNLLMIVLDTVRADHLQPYGYARDTMPFLTHFVAGATLFEHAVAASSYTLPSHATLFTGLLPERHGARVVDAGVSLDGLGLLQDTTPVAPLADGATTLAELARASGMATGAVAANLAYLSPAFGLGQGFDDYIVPTQGWSRWQPAGLAIGRKLSSRLLSESAAWWYRSRITGQGRFYLLASEVNALTLRWLESRRDRRFFLFLNYMDAHAPYLPAPGYREEFPASDAPQGGGHEASIDAYDAELRYLDANLSALFDQLQAWRLLDRTLVVIVGDHGESFGEHGEFEHATGLHEHQLHVPLVLKQPGQQRPARVARSVHLADLLPTLSELLALEEPNGLDGTPLFAEERAAPVTAHLGPYAGIRSRDAIYLDGFKLIRIEGEPLPELYDLRRDPDERNDLAATEPDRAAELSRALERVKEAALPRFDAAPAELDEETRERLRALGYDR